MIDGKYDYFDDEELEALIEEVERSGMIAPPVYLKELIMEGASHVEDSLEGSGEETHEKGPHVGIALERRQEVSCGRTGRRESIRETAKRQFLMYSFKIVAAAAVAVISLTVVPMEFAGERMAEDNHIERQIEKDAERYQEAKRDALKQEEDGESGLWSLMGGRLGDRIWNGLNDWLGMEE